MKVLLIDDEPTIVRLVKQLVTEPTHLIPGGVKFESASTMIEGQKKIADFRPDIVILDLSLPDSPQLLTMDLIPAISTVCPVVVLTGNENPSVIDTCMKHGAADFKCKDHDMQYLQHAILVADYTKKNKKRLDKKRIRRQMQDVAQSLSSIRHR